MFVRTFPISSAALAKSYLYPEDAIHCLYCGNHPGVGRVKYDFSVIPGGKVCCIVTHVVQKQKTLDVEFHTTIDSSSKPTVWLARSTGQTQTSLAVSKETACESDVDHTVQSTLMSFCGQ